MINRDKFFESHNVNESNLITIGLETVYAIDAKLHNAIESHSPCLFNLDVTREQLMAMLLNQTPTNWKLSFVPLQDKHNIRISFKSSILNLETTIDVEDKIFQSKTSVKLSKITLF